MTSPMGVEVKMEEEKPVATKPALTPPASDKPCNANDSGSDLSDVEPENPNEEDGDEILPDHYWGGGRIPVFKPTMDQFRSFKTFIGKVDKYGMKTGIVKVIPPKEWRDTLHDLDEMVKTIKVKNPIMQEFHGTHGTYTQANMERSRTYNLPAWRKLCEESNHQPPAKRGERRRNQERPTRAAPKPKKEPGEQPEVRRGRGRPPRAKPPVVPTIEKESTPLEEAQIQVPPTPKSPTRSSSVKHENPSDDESSTTKPKGRQPKSVTSRRKNNRNEQNDVIDEEAFKNFDYRAYNQNEWTPKRCQELEVAYWKSLNFNNPMYGADMPGSLFDEHTEAWNVAKLENLLDVLGQKVPGVNTAYLYLGMWKATFAWHLEDVDLYSINYIHFGAPKQWYSISQADARRFEAAMRSIWPSDAKNCDQFLRHKTYLVSPTILKSQFNIEVNRLVHYEGEFVITYPYGYHSGYNLGYNCAESVNFATESWLDYGKVARKCNCESDSVWIDVWDIERKLRGEATPEYFEETDEDDELEDDGPTDLPTPPGSEKGKIKTKSSKRKRDVTDKDSKSKTKRLRIKVNKPVREPCMLCPNDCPFEPLLPTDNGQKAHRRCADYCPDVAVLEEDGIEKVFDVANIDKDRFKVKCSYCRIARGTIVQCSKANCSRSFHATCAAPAGVQVEVGPMPVFDVDGTEYIGVGHDFRCRLHRPRRDKKSDTEDTCVNALENNSLVARKASHLARGNLVQTQFFGADIIAGYVLENRRSEGTLLLEVMPTSKQIEVEYKWLLVFDPANAQLPAPSENARPLPAQLLRRSNMTADDPTSELPKVDEVFHDPNCNHKWAEFSTAKLSSSAVVSQVNLTATNRLWYYLGETSTEYKSQYTGDPAKKQHDPASNYLDTVKELIAPPARASTPKSKSAKQIQPTGLQFTPRQLLPPSGPMYGHPMIAPNVGQTPHTPIGRSAALERPYSGKYAVNDPSGPRNPPMQAYHVDAQALQRQNQFLNNASLLPQPRLQDARSENYQFTQEHMYPPHLAHGFSAPSTNSQQSPRQQQHQQQPLRRGESTTSQRKTSSSPMVGHHEENRFPPVLASVNGANPATNPTGGGPNTNVQSVTGYSGPSLPGLQQSDSAVSSRPSTSSRSRSDSVQELASFPYLYSIALERPPVYKSPYAIGGGFTEKWTPGPEELKPLRPRGSSLTEEFLKHRTADQRKALVNHTRQISTERAISQKMYAERRQMEQKQRSATAKAFPFDVPSAISPISMSSPVVQVRHQQAAPHVQYQQSAPVPQAHHYLPYNAFHAAPPQAFHEPHPLHYGAYQPHSGTNGYFPAPPSNPLQFSSAQDFRLQMQAEAEQQRGQPPKANHYDNFMNAMQNIQKMGQVLHPHAHGGLDPPQEAQTNHGVEGTSGSPGLRQGMGDIGGEMLPVMGERGF